jgi:hypothetical protein
MFSGTYIKTNHSQQDSNRGPTVNSDSLSLTPVIYLPPCQKHCCKHPVCNNTFGTLPPTDSDHLIRSRRRHAQPAQRGNSVLQSAYGYIKRTYHTTGQPTTGIPPPDSIRCSIPYSASPRLCRTRRSISPTHRLQLDAQVQPTHAPINTDKATRLSTVHNHFQLEHRTTLT